MNNRLLLIKSVLYYLHLKEDYKIMEEVFIEEGEQIKGLICNSDEKIYLLSLFNKLPEEYKEIAITIVKNESLLKSSKSLDIPYTTFRRRVKKLEKIWNNIINK